MKSSSSGHPHRWRHRYRTYMRFAVAALTLLTATSGLVLHSPSSSTATTTTLPQTTFIAPVDPLVVVRDFSPPAVQWGAGHRGVDLEVTPGASIRSPADGVVTYAGMVAGRPVLTILHAGGLRSSFEPVETTLIAGQPVAANSVIGTLAESYPHCPPSSCLHWGVRDGNEYINPLALVPGQGPVVLLTSARQTELRYQDLALGSSALSTRPNIDKTPDCRVYWLPGSHTAEQVLGRRYRASASAIALRNLLTAAVCICETRDSVTPRTRPISAKVWRS